MASHVLRPILLAALFSSCAGLILPAAARAQQTPGAPAAVRAQEKTAASAAQERDRGIGLYESGDFKAAIKSLSAAVKLDKDDGEAWHYLGLALHREGETKEARKAAEKAVKLRPNFLPSRVALAYLLLLSNKLRDALREAEAALALDPRNAEAHYIASTAHLRRRDTARALEEVEAALKTKPDFASALLLKSQALLSSVYLEENDSRRDRSAERVKRTNLLLKQAAESLEKYFQLNPSPPDADVYREQLASLLVYARNLDGDASSPDRTIFLPSEAATKAQLLTRPEPSYTQEARKNQVEGTVILRAVFAADGTVKHIIVLRALPYGLTERAINAARKIKFVPATRDGRPVSQFIQIEYNFNLY